MVFESLARRLTFVTLGICIGIITTFFVSVWFLDESYTTFEGWSLHFDWASLRPQARPGFVILRGSNNWTDETEPIESTQGVPHVTACNQCFFCHRDKPDAPSKQEDFPDSFRAHEVFPLDSHAIWSQIPGDGEPFAIYRRESRASKSNCTECYGCRHELLPVTTKTTMLNATFTMEIGGTRAWVFRVEKGPMVERAASGMAYVKVWCLPLMKKVDQDFKPCPVMASLQRARNLLGLDQLVEDCGFDSLVARAWKGQVDGVVPGTGIIVDWEGIWFNAADGVSLSREIFGGGSKRITPLELLKKLNPTEVILAALFELLTSQADRHAQNIFINENAKITLIDNEKALLESGAIDSIFLPTTHKHAIVHLGNTYLEKKENRRPKPSLEAMLDYRCYAPGGVIGKKYPPKLQQCMGVISTMSPEAIVARYSVQSLKSAKVLRQRAEDMLHQGFEWTLENSKKDDEKRYAWFPTCCHFDKGGNCLDDWNIEDFLD